ncbi:Meiotic nuclear division protein 1 [Vanrija pseudolonga]|uniref:Meiotic nuclear division protein 1 n=1 Tax=Vanrija pseudolonga TaxID=143232 RepID=A0AAF1BK03_9TREE|nr:Meiotic nuclear division protein 1 [Vanrija pseudolonga]
MSKRGLSREEKKTKSGYHSRAEFYTLKELEKIAPIQQTVKEILDELVSDNLVIFDKIGTSNYYWSFPSAAGAAKQAQLDKAAVESEALKTKIKETKGALKAAEKGREDTPERRKLLASLAEVQATSASLKVELAAFGAADPIMYERKKKAIEVAKAASVRWTDNVSLIVSYLRLASGESESDLRAQLGVPDNWDDLDISK